MRSYVCVRDFDNSKSIIFPHFVDQVNISGDLKNSEAFANTNLKLLRKIWVIIESESNSKVFEPNEQLIILHYAGW